MKTISLTQGQFTIVDDEDYERLNQFKWHIHGNYARTTALIEGKHKKIMMHRMIVNISNTKIIDHANGNGLDNRKENLRICTKMQNSQNRQFACKNKLLGIKGVYWRNDSKKFRAAIRVNKKLINLGSFCSLRLADFAYREAESKYFGEFSRN